MVFIIRSTVSNTCSKMYLYKYKISCLWKQEHYQGIHVSAMYNVHVHVYGTYFAITKFCNLQAKMVFFKMVRFVSFIGSTISNVRKCTYTMYMYIVTTCKYKISLIGRNIKH